MEKKSKKSFTLLEVLITLGIIGVLAAFTIPSLVSNVTAQTFNTANTVFIAKLKEMTNQMSINDELTGYSTNEGFADTFARYAKVSKRCTSTNLTSCFVPKFTTGSGEVINTTSLTTSTSLATFKNTNPLVGFTLINGTNIIMAYDPNCASAEADKYKLQANKTYCMSMLYDTNASSGPNKMGKDILTLNASISTCDIPIGSLCVAAGDTTFSPDGTYVFTTDGRTYPNWWLGAKEACEAQSMRLPTKDELVTMYNAYPNGTFPGINVAGWYWSSTEISSTNGAWYQSLSNGDNTSGSHSKGYADSARCVK